MLSPVSPQTPRPRLPSRRTGAILAAFMLAAGIALGALIGPGPAVSLASSQRAAALARILGLIALDDNAGAGAGALLTPSETHAPSSTPTGGAGSAGSETGVASRALASGTGTGGVSHGAGTGSGGATHGAGASSAGAAGTEGAGNSSGAPSPTAGAKTHTGSGEGEAKPKPLPPIAQVWLIVLPYGQSFANVLHQPTAAPYIDGQLLAKGTLLSSYSSLAASQLAGAATLLSGQETAAQSTLSPATCAGTSGTAGSGSAGTGTGTAGTSTGASSPAGSGEGASCPAGEPAGVQAADDYVREVVSRVMASAEYREHGLIAITFAPTPGANASAATADGRMAAVNGRRARASILGGESRPRTRAGAIRTFANTSTPASTAGSPLASTAATEPASPPTPAAPSAAVYPPGTTTSTLSAAGAPAGVLLLSPFLSHPGGRSASAFDALAPRKSLEEVLAPAH